MFCMHCGKEIDDNATFCGYCGGKMPGKEAAIRTETQTATGAKPTGSSGKPAGGTRKKTTIIAITICAVVVVACVVIGLLLVNPKPAPVVSNSDRERDTYDQTDNNNYDDSLNRNVTVKFQLIGWGSPGDEAMANLSAKVNKVLDEIGKDYTVELSFMEGPPDYDDRTNLMLSSGADEFDIIFISNWAANYYGNAAAGYLTELDPYLEKYPDIERILTTEFMRASNVGGKQYALPTNKEKARQVGWVIRQDIADQMGMDVNAILALPYSQRQAALEPYFYQAAELGYYINPNFVLWDYQYSRIIEPIIMGRAEPNDYEAVVADLEPRLIDAVKQISQWHADGLINPNKTDADSGDSEFQAGHTFAVTYQLKPGKDKELEPSIGFQLTQIPMNQPEIDPAETTGAMLAIPVGSKNKDNAFDFISLLYTEPRVLNTIINGEEGVDYTRNADGRISYTDTWHYGNSWTLGDQYKSYLTDVEDLDKWDQFIAFNEEGWPLPLLGFVPDTSDVNVQTWMAGMRAVRENYGDLFRGYYPVDQVDAQFAQLRSDYEVAGMNELVAAMQAQIDAWRAGS